MQMDIDVDIDKLDALLDELVSLPSSPNFLSGGDGSCRATFEFGKNQLAYEVRHVREYIAAIDIHKQATPYVLLRDEFASEIEAAYHFVSYGSSEIADFFRAKRGALRNGINASPRVRLLADYACASDDTRDDPDVLFDHAVNTISWQLTAVAFSRALTLSRRFAPLEVVFRAYEAGLYPFGWVWGDSDTDVKVDTVVCVRPPAAS